MWSRKLEEDDLVVQVGWLIAVDEEVVGHGEGARV